MIRNIRNSFFTRYFWGFIAFYVLNCSVDAPDFYDESLPENLSINDQESIIEMIVEKVLGFEDAITEYDDYDRNQEHLLKKNSSIEVFNFTGYSSASYEGLNIFKRKRIYEHEKLFPIVFVEVISPPPEV